jgi:hypothetical protein
MAVKTPVVLNANGTLELLQSGDSIPYSILSGVPSVSWTTPGTIGSTTPNTGVFSQLDVTAAGRTLRIKQATDPANGSIQATFITPNGGGGRLYFGESVGAFYSLNFSNVVTLENVPGFQTAGDLMFWGLDQPISIYRGSASRIFYQASGGGSHEFFTRPADGSFVTNASQTLAFKIAQSGQIQAKANIASTSTTTGGLVVDYGCGIGGALNVGGAINTSDKPTTRTNLGLAIGTDVQAYSARLAEIVSGFAGAANGQVVRKNAGGTALEYATVSSGGVSEEDAIAYAIALG